MLCVNIFNNIFRSTFYVDVIGKKIISKSYIHCKLYWDWQKISIEKSINEKKVLKKEKSI